MKKKISLYALVFFLLSSIFLPIKYTYASDYSDAIRTLGGIFDDSPPGFSEIFDLPAGYSFRIAADIIDGENPADVLGNAVKDIVISEASGYLDLGLVVVNNFKDNSLFVINAYDNNNNIVESDPLPSALRSKETKKYQKKYNQEASEKIDHFEVIRVSDLKLNRLFSTYSWKNSEGKVTVYGTVVKGTSVTEVTGIVVTGYDRNNKPIETKTVSSTLLGRTSKLYSVVLDTKMEISRVEVKVVGYAQDIELLSSADRIENGKVIVTGSVENGRSKTDVIGIVATGYNSNNKPIETKTISRSVLQGISDSFNVILDGGTEIARVEVKAIGKAQGIELLSSADRIENGKVIVTGSVENRAGKTDVIGIVATGYNSNNRPIETKTISRSVLQGISDSFNVILDAGTEIARVEVKVIGNATDIELQSFAYRNSNNNTITATAVVENGNRSTKNITLTFTGYDINGKPVEVKKSTTTALGGYSSNYSVVFSSVSQIVRIGVGITPDSNQLKVHYLDVGQADSILLKNNVGTILIDSGGQSTSNKVVGYLTQQGITKIDYLILTHPHEDHIGGAESVLNNFEVGTVIMPEVPSVTTEVYNNLISTIIQKNITLVTPEPGMSCSIGEIECTIIAPNNETYSQANEYSIVTKVNYKNTSFLFTGDAGSMSETEMIDFGYNLHSNVLKVGHHGSKTATSTQFLQEVNPQHAIITLSSSSNVLLSQEVIDRLLSNNIFIYRTDASGNIVVTSDGQTLTFNTETWNN